MGHPLSAAFDSKSGQLILIALLLMIAVFRHRYPFRSWKYHSRRENWTVRLLRFGNMTTNVTGDLVSAGVSQVLEVGCGVARFAAYLLPLNIQTLSFAPKDGHENQIQFALERGIGAMISALAIKQLPYPSNSFEMVHCSCCQADWHENGKVCQSQ